MFIANKQCLSELLGKRRAIHAPPNLPFLNWEWGLRLSLYYIILAQKKNGLAWESSQEWAKANQSHIIKVDKLLLLLLLRKSETFVIKLLLRFFHWRKSLVWAPETPLWRTTFSPLVCHYKPPTGKIICQLFADLGYQWLTGLERRECEIKCVSFTIITSLFGVHFFRSKL